MRDNQDSTVAPLHATRGIQPWVVVVGALLLIAGTIAVTLLVVKGVPSISASQSSEPSLTEPQRAAIDAAVYSLGKVNAAIEVGVNFQTYGQLLIDAKAATNHATEMAPNTPNISILNETMQDYVDAAQVWQSKIKYPNLKLRDMFGDGALIKKYHLQATGDKDDTGVDKDVAMQKIWLAAGINYAKLVPANTGRSAN